MKEISKLRLLKKNKQSSHPLLRLFLHPKKIMISYLDCWSLPLQKWQVSRRHPLLLQSLPHVSLQIPLLYKHLHCHQEKTHWSEKEALKVQQHRTKGGKKRNPHAIGEDVCCVSDEQNWKKLLGTPKLSKDLKYLFKLKSVSGKDVKISEVFLSQSAF